MSTVRRAIGGFAERQYALLRALARDQEGVTALEYALIASVIVVTISAFVPDILQALTTTWTNISTALS